MKKISLVIITVNKEATWLTLISLLILLIKIFIFNSYPSIFNGAYAFGLIVESILVSVLASYVFYFFVVHFKEHSDRLFIHPYIEKHAIRPVGDCINQLREIEKIVGTPMPLEKIDKLRIKSAFEKINPHSNAPLILSPSSIYANWFQYFDYNRNRTRNSINRVFVQLIYDDAKLLSLLSAIDECSHFLSLDITLSNFVKNQDMSAWASTFTDYCKLCNELNNYCEKNFKYSVKNI